MAALPIWINYMQSTLKGVPETMPSAPEGVINVGGEFYYREYAPGENGVQSIGLGDGMPEGEQKADEVRNQGF